MRRTPHRGQGLVSTAVVAAAAAILLLIILYGSTLALDNDARRILVILSVVFLVTLAPLAFHSRKMSCVSRSVSALLLLCFCVFAAASIGLLFMPSALSMLAAAVVAFRPRRETAVPARS